MTNNNNIIIHRLNENKGHLVFWEEKSIYEKYSKGYYVVTDADIVPLDTVPIRALTPRLAIRFPLRVSACAVGNRARIRTRNQRSFAKVRPNPDFLQYHHALVTSNHRILVRSRHWGSVHYVRRGG